jgi:hypothetical protein
MGCKLFFTKVIFFAAAALLFPVRARPRFNGLFWHRTRLLLLQKGCQIPVE